MNTFYLDNNNVKMCTHFKDRLIGMMFKKKKSNYIYCFPKCKSVHTFFMFKKIDIVMTDKNNNILYYFKGVKPWKVLLPKKNVYYIYEFDSNLIDIGNYNKIEL